MNTPVIPQLPLGLKLRVSADFEGFHTGGNLQAVSDIKACANGLGERFIFLWGKSGSGKSHLLQAACRLAADLGHTSTYIPLGEIDQFTPEILVGLEDLCLISIDDLQHIATNHVWENALFRLFNRLQESGSRLLIGATGAPQTLGIGLADLSSRLNGGLSIRLKPLDDAGRWALLKDQADRRGLSLPDECATYILHHASRDTRHLVSLLEQLDNASLAAQRPLTVPFIKMVLESSRNFT